MHYWVLTSDSTVGMRTDVVSPSLWRTRPCRGKALVTHFGHRHLFITLCKKLPVHEVSFPHCVCCPEHSSHPRPPVRRLAGGEPDGALRISLDTNHFICFTFKGVGLNHSHSVFLQLCCVLVPGPIITIKQVDFRPNCTGKWHFAFSLALWRGHTLLRLLSF